MLKKYITFILCSYLFVTTLSAQRFDGGVSLGMNMSELGKAGIDSYIGLTVGFRAVAKMKKKWQLSTELLYSQQGDYLPDFQNNFDKLFLQYLEVPIQSHHLFLWDSEKQVHQIHLNYGLTYARLIASKVITMDGIELPTYFDSVDVNRLLTSFGISGYFNQHLGIDWRGTMSLNGNFTLTFKGIYLF